MEISHRRPKFWLHRSGRFWFGLVVLLFLGSSYLVTYFRGWSASCTRVSNTNTQWFRTSTELSISMGELVLSHISEVHDKSKSIAPPSSKWSWDWRTEGLSNFSARSFAPFDPFASSIARSGFTIPLWIAPILWSCIWLWWMRHADRREEQIFGYRSVKE